LTKKTIVGLVEQVKIVGKKRVRILGKFDTGARKTSIDHDLVEKLNFKKQGMVTIENVHGKSKRQLVKIKLMIRGRLFKIYANIANRSSRRFKILLGRDVIFNNFAIDISKSHNSPNVADLKKRNQIKLYKFFPLKKKRLSVKQS